MRKLLFILLSCSLLTGAISCSEDFQVTAPYKDITFIYGFLDMRDTAHYIRIQKAFLDENKSAIDMAKEADSNFYNSLEVRIKELSGTNVVWSDLLTRVDMNQEGYPKDSGVFFSTPNYAYKFKRPLNANYKYRLVVSNLATGDVDSSEISIIDTADMEISEIYSTGYKIRFDRTSPSNLAKFQIVAKAGPDARYLESMLRFHWTEKNLNDGSSTDKSANFRFATEPVEKVNAQQSLDVQNTSIYAFLRDAIKPAPAGVERYLDSVDLFVYAGGVDYYNYIATSLIQAGITADQAKPTFTNILGDDVYGMFSTRTIKFRLNIPIDSTTLDSIQANPLTSPLNVRGFTDH